MIKYTTTKAKSGLTHAIVQLDNEYDFRSFCEYVGENSTLKLDRGHVEHVLTRVVDSLIELLKQNCSVTIENLGKFQPRVRINHEKPEIGVLFYPSRNGVMRVLKFTSIKKLEEDWDPFPKNEPITKKEQKRRMKELEKE